MAGDHKCPVCQATFTRPQHVARHMRSRKHFLSSLLRGSTSLLSPSISESAVSFAPSSLQIPAIVHTSVSIVEISSLEGLSIPFIFLFSLAFFPLFFFFFSLLVPGQLHSLLTSATYSPDTSTNATLMRNHSSPRPLLVERARLPRAGQLLRSRHVTNVSSPVCLVTVPIHAVSNLFHYASLPHAHTIIVFPPSFLVPLISS